jgi:hypothetical protein
MEGKPALDSDVNLGGIYASSEWRWVLENMQVSRKKGNESKNFPIEYIEDKLEKIIIREGEEGTKFIIEDAKKIVDIGIAIPKRIKDSHDILGTFNIVSNSYEMSITPATPDDLIKILKHRYLTMMSGRAEEVNAGDFKSQNNRAGSTEFVDFTLVEGTLKQGFKYYAALNDPMAKAVFIMFVISEVHPFTDGNGRISRIMGNAELFKSGLSRIIVPTVYREDYIMSLKKFTNRKEPDTFIRVMDKLQYFSNNIFGDNFDELNNYFKATDAYKEPSEGKLKIIDRSMPDIKLDEI